MSERIVGDSPIILIEKKKRPSISQCELSELDLQVEALLMGSNGIYESLLNEAQKAGILYTQVSDIYRKGNCEVVSKRLAEKLRDTSYEVKLMVYKKRPIGRVHHYFVAVIHPNGQVFYIDPTWQQCLSRFNDEFPAFIIWEKSEMENGSQPYFWTLEEIAPDTHCIWTDAVCEDL